MRLRLRPISFAAVITTGLTITVGGVGAQSAKTGIEGRWGGALTIMGAELPFSVTFERVGIELRPFSVTEDSLSRPKATMDIPAQGAFDLPLTSFSYENSRVHFELQAGIGLAVWDGIHEGDVIEGEFTQNGALGTFRIERDDVDEVEEEPELLPYQQEVVTFENGQFHFEGTLTLPHGPGPYPAVVMITGSGPQDRDEQIFGFRPFKIIADHLTRLKIAVYRYDDRGVGGSTGSVSEATSSDFADDVLAAVARVGADPRIDAARIGLIGHSEGGIVAPIAANRSKAISFAVLLAGTSVTGAEVIYEQAMLIARAANASEADIAEQTHFQQRMFEALSRGEDLEQFRDEMEADFRQALAMASPEEREAISDIDEFIETRVNAEIGRIQTPWFRYFLSYDPADALRQVKIPILALFGEMDLQVSPAQNYELMVEALSGNDDVTIELIPGANHLFQEAVTGSPNEYPTLDKSFIPGFLEKISDWILART